MTYNEYREKCYESIDYFAGDYQAVGASLIEATWEIVSELQSEIERLSSEIERLSSKSSASPSC